MVETLQGDASACPPLLPGVVVQEEYLHQDSAVAPASMGPSTWKEKGFSPL